MFIARRYLNNGRSIGANHLGGGRGYKHVAPTEQGSGQLKYVIALLWIPSDACRSNFHSASKRVEVDVVYVYATELEPDNSLARGNENFRKLPDEVSDFPLN